MCFIQMLTSIHSAVQFVQGTTQNPLVKGPNVTNSDGRIFNADGGSVIRQLSANNAQFLATCNSLLERMLNVVPTNVRLTAPITPIPVKPVDIEIQIAADGSLQFSGNIRVSPIGMIIASHHLRILARRLSFRFLRKGFPPLPSLPRRRPWSSSPRSRRQWRCHTHLYRRRSYWKRLRHHLAVLHLQPEDLARARHQIILGGNPERCIVKERDERWWFLPHV
jgi:hypothetical protein